MVTELRPMPFSVSVYSQEQSFLLDPEWHTSTGVPDVDYLLDVRNVVLGASAAISLKPAIQLATTRVDRPDDPVTITNGSPVTAANLVKYLETLSAAGKFYFRRGLGYKLTAGSFARAEGLLYTSFRSLGLILPAEQVVFNPWNDVNDYAVFPLNRGRPLPTTRVDKAKLVVFGMGNLTTTMGWRLAARAFNDPLARGAWTLLQSDYTIPQTADFELNTGEITFTGITLTNFMWLELALAVRKTLTNDNNSRVIFNVLPALLRT